MKQAANDWNGREFVTLNGSNHQVREFPGYEWRPTRVRQASPLNPFPNDLNSDDNTPGHINYFSATRRAGPIITTSGSPATATVTRAPRPRTSGSPTTRVRRIDRRDSGATDPPAGRSDRPYDLLIQYNHPAASIDKGVRRTTSRNGSTSSTAAANAAWRTAEPRAARTNARRCGVLTESRPSNGTPIKRRRLARPRSMATFGAAVHRQPLSRCHFGALPPRHSPFSRPLCHLARTARGLHALLHRWLGQSQRRKLAPNGFPGSRGAGSKSLTGCTRVTPHGQRSGTAWLSTARTRFHASARSARAQGPRRLLLGRTDRQ